jgi:hypothetical protein
MLSAPALKGLRAAAALALVAITAQSLGAFGDGAPSLISPYPLPFTLLALLGVPVFLLAILFGALFYFACRRAVLNELRRPNGAAVALGVTTIASIGYFVTSWHYGIEYQGKLFVNACIRVNAAAVLGLLVMLALNYRRATPLSVVAFYFALFAWIGTYAFPYFGEGP